MTFPQGLLWLVVQVEFYIPVSWVKIQEHLFSTLFSLYLLLYVIPIVFCFQLSMWTFFSEIRLRWNLLNKNHLELLKVIFITICDLYYHSDMFPSHEKASCFSLSQHSLNIMKEEKICVGKRNAKIWKIFFHRLSLICNQC